MSPLLLPFEFSKVIPHSENKIKRGLKKNYIQFWNVAFFFIKYTLWGSSVMEGVSGLLLQPLLQGCSADGRSSFPDKTAGQKLPLGKCHVLPGPEGGWPGWSCPQLKARRLPLLSLFAEEASPDSSGRGRSEPAWPTTIFLARCLAASGAICHLQGHCQHFPSQQSCQISEDQWKKRISIFNPCQHFLPLLFGSGLARTSW